MARSSAPWKVDESELVQEMAGMCSGQGAFRIKFGSENLVNCSASLYWSWC